MVDPSARRPRLGLAALSLGALALASMACRLTPVDDTAGSASEASATTSEATGATTSATDATATTGGATEATGGETGDIPPQGPPPAAGKNPFPWSLESRDAVCDDDLDNDDNSYFDCDDFACSRNPSVVVCGPLTIYESTPTACQNGMDDDGDGKADCDDPDCRKNPFLNVCLQPRVEDRCGEGVDGDGDGLINCDDNDCLALDASCVPKAGSLRILFDLTLDETAANGPSSDWMIDPWGRLPTPSNPASRNEWSGSLSSFAFDLYKRGHRIEQLASWEGALSFGDPQNPQDLGLYDVLVVIEPSRQLSAAEKGAIINFVDAGGGLLLIANHISADRDGNGWSAAAVFNDLFDDNPIEADPFALRFDEIDIEQELTLERIEDAAHPVIAGPAGTVDRIGLYVATTAHLTGSNPGASGLIVLDAAASSSVDVVVGAAPVGSGRLVFVTDSAIIGDGTDSHGTSLAEKDAYNDPALDHAALFVNAVTWLGGL